MPLQPQQHQAASQQHAAGLSTSLGMQRQATSQTTQSHNQAPNSTSAAYDIAGLDDGEVAMNYFGSSFEEAHTLARHPSCQAQAQGLTQGQAQGQNQTAPPNPGPALQGPSSVSMDATAPFLANFSLVAEAAKRAQLAVMTRDLEGISLA